MTSLPDLFVQGTAHAWLFVPTAILLGALHGLEPGHSKTMMAAFIVAVRGTVAQAALLGLSAALSHTAVVWVIALGGQSLGRNLDAEAAEPYFQIGSAVLVLVVAGWMMWRTWRDQRLKAEGHQHDHGHHHGDGIGTIDTGHGMMALEVFEDGVPPRFRIRFETGQGWPARDVKVVTERPDGARQAFAFANRGGVLESLDEIPEPHEFNARVSLGHGGHSHHYDVAFAEHDHGREAVHADARGLTVIAAGEYSDAHERAHANDIARRFSGQTVTTGQIIAFGLTGGLIPCPAAITVLLLCLQLKQLSLGVVLVLCFSIGLAATMVTAGVIAALSVRHVQKRWSGFGAFARRAPYASSALMALIAVCMAYSGWVGLKHGSPLNASRGRDAVARTVTSSSSD